MVPSVGNMTPISVLLVDDNPTFRRIATRFLEESSGHEVAVVGSAAGGEEALVEAARLRPHVVLMDLRMPGVGGLDTIPRLKGVLPEAAIVVLTLYDTEGYRQASLQVGADEFVCKARMHSDLLPAIRRAAEADVARAEPQEPRSPRS